METAAEIDVHEAGAVELEAAMALRERVFVGEQKVDRAADVDGLDGDAVQLVAVIDGEVAGTCRLLPEDGVFKLGRMAVDPRHRRRGVAAALLEHSEARARADGMRAIALHAQLAAESVYASAGYSRAGGVFAEEGIDHVRMTLEL